MLPHAIRICSMQPYININSPSIKKITNIVSIQTTTYPASFSPTIDCINEYAIFLGDVVSLSWGASSACLGLSGIRSIAGQECVLDKESLRSGISNFGILFSIPVASITVKETEFNPTVKAITPPIKNHRKAGQLKLRVSLNWLQNRRAWWESLELEGIRHTPHKHHR